MNAPGEIIVLQHSDDACTDDECRMQVYQSNKFLLSSNLLLVFLAIAIQTANIRDATLHGNLDLGTNPGLNLLP